MTRKLRRRIVLAFVSFAIFVAATFGVSTAVFLYSVEDSFFQSMLQEESARLERESAAGELWAAPSVSYMTVYDSESGLPPDLREQVRKEPMRREFAGDSGRHYHVRALFRAEAGSGAVPTTWLVAEVSDRLVVRPMRRALLAQWLFIEAFVLAIAVAIALRIARRIAEPLSSLAQAVDTLDLTQSQPIVVRNADHEVAMVTRALEDMRSRVQAFIAREQLFTRDASHELRTPLSVIRSTTAQALDDPSVSATSRRLLTLAQQAAEQLERTVASLLALAREHSLADAGAHTPVLPALERVVLEQTAVRETNSLSLELALTRADSLPVSDSVLHILLSNLIGNAFAHSAPGVVRVSMRDGVLRIENPVRPDVLENPTALATAGVRRDGSPGYGLGLAIVERLCERTGLTFSIPPIADGAFEVVLGPAPSDRHSTHSEAR